MSSFVLLEKYTLSKEHKINNGVIFPKYFLIINPNQFSLKPTREDTILLIFPITSEGRRDTRHQEWSLCSSNSSDKAQTAPNEVVLNSLLIWEASYQ